MAPKLGYYYLFSKQKKAIPLLELYPKNTETPIQKNLCTPMFIAAQLQ